MTHKVSPKQRKGNDKERIQTKCPIPPPAKTGHKTAEKRIPVAQARVTCKRPHVHKTLTHFSDHEQQPETPSTDAVVPSDSSDTHLHVTQVLMYTSTVTAKEFIDIDISGFGRNSDGKM